MAVFYYLYQNNRKGSPTKGQWYARVKPIGTRTLKDVAEIIQRNASVKKSDVIAVLTELPEVMNDILSEGYRLKIDGFGAFKVAITSKGAVSPKEYNVGKHITGSRVVFTPDRERKGQTGQGARVIANVLEFKEMSSLKKTKDEDGE